MTLEELFKAVGDWGEAKGINNPVMQYAKNTLPSAETIDAIGDILVTVIIFAKIIGIDPAYALAEAYDTISGRTGKTINGSFVKDN